MKNNKLILNYLKYIEFNKGRSVGTVDNYARALGRLHDYLESKGEGLLSAGYSSIAEFAGLVSHNAGHNVSGRRLIVAAIRGFYNWVELEGVGVNIAARLEYPKPIRSLPVPIQVSNAEKLLNSIKLDSFVNIRDAAIIALFLGTGLRLSGLCALNKSNMEVANIEGKERLFVRVMEKGRKERIVPVPDVMHLFMVLYINHEDYKGANKITEGGEEVLFINTVNNNVKKCDYYGEARRLGARYVEKMIHRRGAVVGIPSKELKPHAMRHLFGTELAEKGVDIHRIQLLLGHEDISTTVKYIHLARRKLFNEVNEFSPLSSMSTPLHDLHDAVSK